MFYILQKAPPLHQQKPFANDILCFDLDGTLVDTAMDLVRVTNEVPDTSYDIYISSGGPGNPLEGNGIWELRFFHLIDRLWQHNLARVWQDDLTGDGAGTWNSL